MQPHPHLPREGETFAERYEVVRCLGVGGMGAVYEAIDARTGWRRALKVMLPALLSDRDLAARFQQEAHISANLASPHIVQTIDAGVDAGGAPFLVMELLGGQDLGARLAGGPLPTPLALTLLAQLAAGLDLTHALGVVHRDLKPANVFLVPATAVDQPPTAKILDFGVAKLVADGSLGGATTRAVGSPLYMAPEQIQGDGGIDGRADLYALAQLTYTMLVGEPYFAAESRRGSIYRVLHGASQGPREPASERAARAGVDLPRGFDVWFARATAADPSARFAWASEQIAQLGAALSADTDPSPASLPAAPPARHPRPSLVLAVPALVLAAVAVAGAARPAAAPTTLPPGEPAALASSPRATAEQTPDSPAPTDARETSPGPDRAPVASAGAHMEEPYPRALPVAPSSRPARRAPAAAARPAPPAASPRDASDER